ncbi:MAG: VCBS repeat-containing protein, partial [Anaerolineae bacterium]|nr:VCBS repeat-containing protein [Anaerolineae bacterium]
MNNNRPICFNVALLRICLRVIASLLTGFVLLLGILSLLDHHDEKTQVVLADNEPVVFTDVTSLAGVDTSSPSAQWGSVWGDYDGDGYQDLYVGNHFYSPNLYRNNGDGTFTDMRASAGIPSGPNDWHGAAWGDYDNDGDLELYVTTGRAINHGNFFYDNNGDGTFIERASAVGIANIGGRGRIPSWIDFDNDGDLDLHVANAVSETAPDVLFRNNGDGTFTDVAAQAGIALNDWSHGATWSDYDGDGYLDFGLTMIGDTFRLYHNQGNGTFVNATASAGIGNYWVESVAWGDYDNDGDSDLYICRLYEDYQDRLVWNTHTMTIVVGTIPGEQEGIDFTTTVPTVSFDLWQSDRVHLSSEITFGSANLHPPDVPFTLDSTTNHIGQPSYAPGQDSGVFIWRDSPTGQWHVRWTGDPRTFQGQITTSGEFGGVTSVGLDIP